MGKVIALVVLAACGRFGFGELPPGDVPPGVDDTIATNDDGTPATCADIGGSACSGAGQICAVAPVATVDVATCCPATKCMAQGTKLLVDASPPPMPITIDGVLTDWTAAPAIALTRKTIGTSAAADFAALVSVRWDSTALYVLMQMADDVCRAQDSVPPRAQAFNDDVVEVYLDMDPTNNTATYGPEEQWTWVPQSCGAGTAICGMNPPVAPLTTELASWVRPPPANNSVPGTRLFATYANNGATNCNWWVEVKVLWPSGSPTPVAGDLLGFDVAANDDDTGLRKNQLFWNDATGALPTDPRRFGLLRLMP